MTATRTLTVRLNGTGVNPYHRYGLAGNPFPQVAEAGWGHVNRLLADLAANPIRDEADLRARLHGCTPEFIAGCCQRFRPGELVTFEITFPADQTSDQINY